MSSQADKEKKRLQQKHEKILNELLSQPENSVCADCGQTGT